MTTQQLQLVRQTWKQALPIRETLGELFYRRLLVMAPGVRALFGVQLERQSRDLLTLCSTVVANLDDLTPFLPRIKDLARRFHNYGITPRHYAAMGEALVWTLEKGLADSWDAEAKAAFRDGFTLISELMMEVQWTASTREL